MYKNIWNSEKQDTRTLVLNQLKNKRKPRVLSLPHKDFLFEQMVSSKYKNAEIFCAENNTEVYQEVINKGVDKKFNYQFSDVFDVFLKEPEKYDLVWLDLCSTLSFEVFNKLIQSVQSLKKGAVLAVTLTGAREQKLSFYKKKYNTSSSKMFRKKIFPKVLTEFASETNPQFQLSHFINYKGGNRKSTPMNLYIFNN